jgi:hypothetical protein
MILRIKSDISLKNINQVGFEVLTAVCTKMAIFWVVVPCSLAMTHRPDDGGSKDL